MSMLIEFWGVRGSYNCWGQSHSNIGGNTSCVSVKLDDKYYIVFDAGSGIIPFGNRIQHENTNCVHLIISHLHLDHLQGLPFFKPLWNPDFSVEFHTQRTTTGDDLRNTLETRLLCPPLFPIEFKDTPAKCNFNYFDTHDVIKLPCGSTLSSISLNHPGGAIGYRLEKDGTKFCYITDHECTSSYDERALLEFIKEADMFIFDTTYTQPDLESHKGWGHSSWNQGVRLAEKANVKKFALFHTNPDYDDRTLLQIEREAIEIFPNSFLAKEGMQVPL